MKMKKKQLELSQPHIANHTCTLYDERSTSAIQSNMTKKHKHTLVRHIEYVNIQKLCHTSNIQSAVHGMETLFFFTVRFCSSLFFHLFISCALFLYYIAATCLLLHHQEIYILPK